METAADQRGSYLLPQHSGVCLRGRGQTASQVTLTWQQVSSWLSTQRCVDRFNVCVWVWTQWTQKLLSIMLTTVASA